MLYKHLISTFCTKGTRPRYGMVSARSAPRTPTRMACAPVERLKRRGIDQDGEPVDGKDAGCALCRPLTPVELAD